MPKGAFDPSTAQIQNYQSGKLDRLDETSYSPTKRLQILTAACRQLFLTYRYMYRELNSTQSVVIHNCSWDCLSRVQDLSDEFVWVLDIDCPGAWASTNESGRAFRPGQGRRRISAHGNLSTTSRSTKNRNTEKRQAENEQKIGLVLGNIPVVTNLAWRLR